jgi:hypothetical protein
MEVIVAKRAHDEDKQRTSCKELAGRRIKTRRQTAPINWRLFSSTATSRLEKRIEGVQPRKISQRSSTTAGNGIFRMDKNFTTDQSS